MGRRCTCSAFIVHGATRALYYCVALIWRREDVHGPYNYMYIRHWTLICAATPPRGATPSRWLRGREGADSANTMTLLPSHPTLMPDSLSVCEEDWQQEEVSKWKLISTLLSQSFSHPLPNTVVSLASPSLLPREELVCETTWMNLEGILTTPQPGLSSCDTLRSVMKMKVIIFSGKLSQP